MSDIDELIERLETEQCRLNEGCNALDICACTKMDEAATALQEMQQTISQLKSSRDAWKIGCHNAAHDLLEAQQRIAKIKNCLSDKFDVAVEKGSPVVLDWETTKHIIELLEGLNND